jgi:hypothetical protein
MISLSAFHSFYGTTKRLPPRLKRPLFSGIMPKSGKAGLGSAVLPTGAHSAEGQHETVRIIHQIKTTPADMGFRRQ